MANFFFGNIRTNINTTHTLGRTHKFTLEIIKSQAAGRPISLEYSKYQAINGNYCFDNIQCSCMHIFLSFFTDLFSSSFCSHIQIHAFWFLLHWTCNHFIEDAMQWVQIDFYFGFFFGNLKNFIWFLFVKEKQPKHIISRLKLKNLLIADTCVWNQQNIQTTRSMDLFQWTKWEHFTIKSCTTLKWAIKKIEFFFFIYKSTKMLKHTRFFINLLEIFHYPEELIQFALVDLFISIFGFYRECLMHT